MPDITSYMAAVLPCCGCGDEFEVGSTRHFTENGTGQRKTAYYHPLSESGDKPIGYSDGTGDTFKCRLCFGMELGHRHGDIPDEEWQEFTRLQREYRERKELEGAMP